MAAALTFLKKLGQVLVKAVGIITGVEPLIAPYLGSAAAPAVTAVNDLTAIGQVVVQAEALFQPTAGTAQTGTQKLAAATPLVANIIKTSELVSGKKIADEAGFTAACEKITSAVADLLNSLDESGVKTS